MERRIHGRPGLMPVVKILLIVTIGMFIIQILADGVTGQAFTWEIFGLSFAGVMNGRIWQFVTYMFLHGGILHILFNMMGLFFFGSDVERVLGPKRFLSLYLVGGVVGGIGWIVLAPSGVAPCIGASGAIFALLAAFAVFYPNRPITLLLFYVVPVTMKARTLVIILGLITLFSLYQTSGNVAHAAHLGGGIVGLAYALMLRRGMGRPVGQGWRGSGNTWNRGSKTVAPPTREEIDSILDKVSSRGIGSLTATEREMLKEASRRR